MPPSQTQDTHKKIGEYSIRELREICQKSAPNPAMETIAGRICRVFSIYTTKLFLYTSFTPNQITIISFFILITSAFTYFGSYATTFLGPFLHFVSITVDGNDGEVARFRKLSSKFGASYVEPISHDIQYGLYFFIISLGLFYTGAPVYVLIAGAIASIAKLLYRFLQLRFWYSYYAGTAQESKDEQFRQYQGHSPLIRFFYFLNRNLNSNPAFTWPLLLATVFARVDLFIYFYALSFTVLFFTLLFKQMRIIARTTKESLR